MKGWTETKQRHIHPHTHTQKGAVHYSLAYIWWYSKVLGCLGQINTKDSQRHASGAWPKALVSKIWIVPVKDEIKDSWLLSLTQRSSNIDVLGLWCTTSAFTVTKNFLHLFRTLKSSSICRLAPIFLSWTLSY